MRKEVLVFDVKGYKRIGIIIALVGIALAGFGAVFFLLFVRGNQGSKIPEIKEYAICRIEWLDQNKKVIELSFQSSQQFLLLCNKILVEGHQMSKESQAKHFYDNSPFRGRETIAFFADSAKNDLVCKIELWGPFPKRAKISTAAQEYYVEVPDVVYYPLREEAKSLEP